MMVEEIELFQVAMPIKAPWKTAFGVLTAIDSVFVRLRMDGQNGWGETTPYLLPQYSAEWAKGVFLLIRDHFAPVIIGRTIGSGAELQERLRSFKGNYFAKAGLDNAWWDSFAKTRKHPLWKVLNGHNQNVVVGADIPVQDSLDELLALISEAQHQGFRRIKLKFSRASRVGMIARVREAFPDMPCHIDCNSGFTLDDRHLFQELDHFGLAMIEQPLAHDDLIDHARLQENLATPICLDESITSLDKTRKALAVGACGWVNIKPGRVGGITNALAIHDYCQAKQIPCWVGSMLESSTGQGASLALATLANMQYPADIFPSQRLYDVDLSYPEIKLSSPSIITAPEAVGHGFMPDLQRIKADTVNHAVLRSN